MPFNLKGMYSIVVLYSELDSVRSHSVRRTVPLTLALGRVVVLCPTSRHLRIGIGTFSVPGSLCPVSILR